ncbi:MAG TPA: heparan-alpha-glucosaminide N-acetyltransferase domain-containing protein [Candidatus Acidoferrum sp.]|nr:heparan-alpha-glucosaminide N-acetyltransferase domain-containing protein [Candidatus Acidoferrum sp.]
MKRLSYIDWMRGLACLLMFQTHCYDSWLRPDQRDTPFFRLSQIGGTLPAPLFIFLAGVSVALLTGRLREKGIARNAIARQTILRGAEVFGYGILFRIQEFLLGFRSAPWTDLLRVDVLNILGLSIMLMGVLCWLASAVTPTLARRRSVFAALLAAALIALATPPLWTTWRPRFLPWPLESYINGVHTFKEPQTWLFPIFPWAAFAFAGLAVGFLIFSEFARRREPLFFALLGLAGMFACVLSVLFDTSSIRLYAVYDYWHSNPDFLLLRCGVLLVILSLVYFWCRFGFAQKGFSPLIQLGNTSLLVYWVHIEFVYGSLTIMPKRACSIPRATLGLAIIFLSMLALSLLRTRWKRSSQKTKSAPIAPERPITAKS